MAADPTQIELSRLEKSVYKSYYIPNKNSTNVNTFSSVFYKSFTNTIWYSTTMKILESTTVITDKVTTNNQKIYDSTTLTYKVENGYDFLIDTTCVMGLP